MDQNRRPSVYLQERAEDLWRVLDFFAAPHRGQAPAREMLVVFLSQLSFWEWELDNLIYAFTTFEERHSLGAREWGRNGQCSAYQGYLGSNGRCQKPQAKTASKIRPSARSLCTSRQSE